MIGNKEKEFPHLKEKLMGLVGGSENLEKLKSFDEDLYEAIQTLVVQKFKELNEKYNDVQLTTHAITVAAVACKRMHDCIIDTLFSEIKKRSN